MKRRERLTQLLKQKCNKLNEVQSFIAFAGEVGYRSAREEGFALKEEIEILERLVKMPQVNLDTDSLETLISEVNHKLSKAEASLLQAESRKRRAKDRVSFLRQRKLDIQELTKL